MAVCSICGKEHDDMVVVGNDYVCQECLEKSDDIIYCNECDNYFYEGDCTYVESVGGYVCYNCLDNYYFKCDECGEYHPNDDIIYAYKNGYDMCICGHCADMYYIRCEECGDYFYEDEIGYNDSLEENVCEHCYDEWNEDIYGYHEFNEWQFYDMGENPAFHIGYELEIDKGNDKRRAVSLVYDNLNAVCMHDGSLGAMGFEIVSHPQSYDYIMSDKTQDIMENVFSKLRVCGYTSHDAGTCGLHFHVSRPDDKTIDRIIFIMETYKEEFIRFSRRTSSQIGDWCNFMSDRVTEDNILKSVYFVNKNKEDYSNNRYTALNLRNSNTIEFRLFRGTLNLSTFNACVELVNNLMVLCSNHNINVNNITWTRLTSTPYAKKYCEEKGILTDRKPTNDSNIVKDIKRKEREIDRYIKEVINIINQRVCELEYKPYKKDDYTNLNNLLEYQKTIGNYYGIYTFFNRLKNMNKQLVYQCAKEYVSCFYDEYKLLKNEIDTLLDISKEMM